MGRAGMNRRWILAVLSIPFTALIVSFSYYQAKLALPPVYEDVVYLWYAFQQRSILHNAGAIAFVKECLLHPPLLAPVTTYFGLAGLTAFGPHVWACYMGNTLIIAFFLWIAAGLLKPAGATTTALCAAAVLAFPICTISVEAFVPDMAAGLMVAFCVLQGLRHPLRRAPWRYLLLLGFGWGLGLVLKPSVSPGTFVFLGCSLGLGIVRDFWLAPRRKVWPAVKPALLAFATAMAVSGPFFATGLRDHLYRWRAAGSTDLWKYKAGASAHALFYLTGDGGARVLGPHLYLIAVAIAAGSYLVLRRSGRRLRWAWCCALLMVLVVYGVYTCISTKAVLAAAALQWLLVFLFLIATRICHQTLPPRTCNRGRRCAPGPECRDVPLARPF